MEAEVAEEAARTLAAEEDSGEVSELEPEEFPALESPLELFGLSSKQEQGKKG